MVHELRVPSQRSGLLAACLSGGAEEYTADLANQCTLAPMTTGRVPEGLHLRTRHTESRGQTQDDCISLGQIPEYTPN